MFFCAIEKKNNFKIEFLHQRIQFVASFLSLVTYTNKIRQKHVLD